MKLKHFVAAGSLLLKQEDIGLAILQASSIEETGKLNCKMLSHSPAVQAASLSPVNSKENSPKDNSTVGISKPSKRKLSKDETVEDPLEFKKAKLSPSATSSKSSPTLPKKTSPVVSKTSPTFTKISPTGPKKPSPAAIQIVDDEEATVPPPLLSPPRSPETRSRSPEKADNAFTPLMSKPKKQLANQLLHASPSSAKPRSRTRPSFVSGDPLDLKSRRLERSLTDN